MLNTNNENDTTQAAATTVAAPSPQLNEEDAKKQRILQRVIQETIATEKTYNESIRNLLDWLQNLTPKENNKQTKALKDLAQEAAIELEKIFSISAKLLAELNQGEQTATSIAKTFLDNSKQLKSAYTNYPNIFNKFNKNIELLQKNKAVNDILTSFSTEPKHKGLSLPSFLIMPVQRVPRYELLLREVQKNSPTEAHGQVELSIAAIKTVAKEINEQTTKESRKKKSFLSKIGAIFVAPLKNITGLIKHRTTPQEPTAVLIPPPLPPLPAGLIPPPLPPLPAAQTPPPLPPLPQASTDADEFLKIQINSIATIAGSVTKDNAKDVLNKIAAARAAIITKQSERVGHKAADESFLTTIKQLETSIQQRFGNSYTSIVHGPTRGGVPPTVQQNTEPTKPEPPKAQK